MFRRIALVALLAAACSKGSARKLVILHTNDEHSHLIGAGPEADDFPAPTTAGQGVIKGGIARRAVLLKSERDRASAEGASTVTLSGGDNMMGTLIQAAATTASPDYRLMKLLGYDATTLGNHEFDYGPAALATSITVAKASAEGVPQIVASNIHFSGTSADQTLADLFDETGADASKLIHRRLIITAANGLRIGLVGIMGVNAASLAPLKAPTRFSVASCCSETDLTSALSQLFDDVQQQVFALRRDKVDLVVAMSHSGVDTATAALGEDYQIAQNVTGIDVIVSGHTHTDYPAQLVTNLHNGEQVLVQQAGRFGDHLGRIELSVDGDGKVSFDTANSTILVVDDKIVGDPTVNAFVSGVIDSMEKTKIASIGKSFLEYTVGLTDGSVVVDDPNKVGDLAFKAIGHSTFTVDNSTAQKETPLLKMAADAELNQIEAIIGPTDMGVEAAGVIRADLQPNKAHELSFADIFRVVPLGASPVSGTIGYPMTRFYIYLAEVKAAFEVTAGLAYTTQSNGDFYIVPSGYCFKYDTARPAFNNNGNPLDPNNGRVTEIRKAATHSLADLDACQTTGTPLYSTTLNPGGGFLVSPLTPISVTTNLYVTTFAYVAGVKLKNAAGGVMASPSEAIVYRDPNTKKVEIKEWEILGSYLKALSSGGDLPSAQYGGTGASYAPTRAICKAGGPLCK